MTNTEVTAAAEKRRKALEELASLFFWELECLDHTGHFDMSRSIEENWLSIAEDEREIYVAALQRMFVHTDLVIAALGERLPRTTP